MSNGQHDNVYEAARLLRLALNARETVARSGDYQQLLQRFHTDPEFRDTAHQIINTGSTPLRYYGISTMSLADVCEYPDSGKFGVFSRHTRNPYDHATIRHLQHLDHKGVDYWDGEPGSEEGKTK